MGGASIDVHGEPLTEEALEIAKKSDAVLMGSIGGNTSTSPWYKLPAQLRPEAGLLKLRKSLGLFANIRPAYLYDCLLYTSKQMEGYREGNWILLDFGDIIIHIFDKENRLFYDLERIWKDGKEVSIEELN